jgi:hypothetical protein
LKKPLWIAGCLVAGLVLVLLVLRVVGLNPYDRFPGLWVTGQVVTTPVTDWSFTSKYPLVAIQTREWFFPPLAHSVNTAFIVHNDKLYIPSIYPAGVEFPDARHWNRNIAHDPHVRLKFGNQLFDRTIVRVTDPAERAALVKVWTTRVPDLGSPGLHLNLFRVDSADSGRTQ